MALLHSGELRIGNTVTISSGTDSNLIDGIVNDCMNVVVLTGENECYFGYSWKIRCRGCWGVTDKSVTQKYGDPMTLNEYKQHMIRKRNGYGVD